MLEASRKGEKDRAIEKKRKWRNGVIVSDMEGAEALNKTFSSVFTLEALGNIPEHKHAFLDKG